MPLVVYLKKKKMHIINFMFSDLFLKVLAKKSQIATEASTA